MHTQQHLKCCEPGTQRQGTHLSALCNAAPSLIQQYHTVLPCSISSAVSRAPKLVEADATRHAHATAAAAAAGVPRSAPPTAAAAHGPLPVKGAAAHESSSCSAQPGCASHLGLPTTSLQPGQHHPQASTNTSWGQLAGTPPFTSSPTGRETSGRSMQHNAVGAAGTAANDARAQHVGEAAAAGGGGLSAGARALAESLYSLSLQHLHTFDARGIRCVYGCVYAVLWMCVHVF